MTLIAKNKIVEYIEKYPEARVDLLTWLEEYPYQEGKKTPSGYKDMGYPDCSSGSSMPGRGDYVIRYRINHTAKTYCITWVGNKKQLDQELKAMREIHPDLADRSTSVQVILTPPRPDLEYIKDRAKSKPQEAQTTFVSNNDPPHEKANLTETAYKKGLARAIAIFEARPNTPEFSELLALLPSISDYEARKLKFPLVYAFEIVILRMNLLQLTNRDLASMVGSSEDEVNLFLSGMLTLPTETLGKLYKFLGIHIPINEIYNKH